MLATTFLAVLLCACSSGTKGHTDAGLGGDVPTSDAAVTGDTAVVDGPTEDGTSADAAPKEPPTVGGCPVFPADDHWNQDISQAPTDATWTERLHALVGNITIHPDLGNYQDEHYGIPFNVVPENQPLVPVTFVDWPEESDPGPYPFPPPESIAIEGGNPYACSGDCHVLVLQQGTCKLYEAYACVFRDGWQCSNGAVWDLRKVAYGQRPKGWTSADAAGLPILPGLLRYEETMAGDVRHAIRFTVRCTRPQYVPPATHFAVPSSCDPNDPNAPPMGLRVRLRAGYDISGLNPVARAAAQAMKTYGMILADNGGDFYFQGEAHLGWDDKIQQLKEIPASEFEVVGPVQPEP